MKLRDYQEDLLKKLFAAFDDGFRAPCIVLPCGGGTSVITAEIAKRFTDSGKRVLFLVHRRELCDQIYYTFLGCGVDLELCKIKMVQTVARRLPRIKRPDLIITDENHHSQAKTYKKIYDFLAFSSYSPPFGYHRRRMPLYFAFSVPKLLRSSSSFLR